MRIQKLMFLFFIAVVASLAYSCGDDDNDMPPEDCPADVSYTMDIIPILTETCAIPNCHINGFPNGDYTIFDDLKAQAESGILRSQIESGAMPRFDTTGPTELTDAQLLNFLCWIEQGALEN